MTLYRQRTFEGEVVELDGHRFEFCRFVECTLLYHGKAKYEIIACDLDRSGYNYAGLARYTVYTVAKLLQDERSREAMAELLEKIVKVPIGH